MSDKSNSMLQSNKLTPKTEPSAESSFEDVLEQTIEESLEQNIEQNIITELTNLALGDVVHVEHIPHGLSNLCFHVELLPKQTVPILCLNEQNIAKVNINRLYYIAKYYRYTTAFDNVEYKTLNVLNNQLIKVNDESCQKERFFPQIIGKTENILLLEKLSGEMLSLASLPLIADESSRIKILSHQLNITIAAMVKLHQIDIIDFDFLTPLNFERIFEKLFLDLPKSFLKQKRYKAKIAELITAVNDCFLAKEPIAFTLCHGDLNFTNVMVNQQCGQLIDFESMSLMPAEYEIAMMLAVNELDLSFSDHCLSCYQAQMQKKLIAEGSTNKQLNKVLVGHYYGLALLINGLWYLGRYYQTSETVYQTKANRQLALLPCF